MKPFLWGRTTSNKFWVGLHLTAYGNFLWEDESLIDLIRWAPKQPNHYDGFKCASMWRMNMKWYSGFCSELNPFVCNIEKIVPNNTKIGDKELNGRNSFSGTTFVLITMGILLFVSILVFISIYVYFTRKQLNSKKRTEKRFSSRLQDKQSSLENDINLYSDACDEYQTGEYSEYYAPLYDDVRNSLNNQDVNVEKNSYLLIENNSNLLMEDNSNQYTPMNLIKFK